MKKNIIVIIIITVIIVIFPKTVLADTLDISLSPSIIELTTTPGSSLLTPLTLTNYTDSPLLLTPSFKPILIGENASASAWFHLEKDNIKLGETFALRPQETGNLTLVIDTPKDATASDSYFHLIFTTQNKRDTQNTASLIEAGIGTNILLSVYEPHDSYQPKVTLTQVVSKPPNFSFTLQNKGNHFVKVKGSLEITDFTGNKITTLPIAQTYIFAHQDRLFENLHIDSTDLFGKYNARLIITINDKDQLTKTTSFYVVPQDTMLKGLVGLGIFLIFLYRISRYMKKKRLARYNKKKR